MALYANGHKVAPIIKVEKEEQSKTLTLGSATPQTVTPDTGKALSSVPVTLDTSVIKAENIAKDVQILGITGTHEGGVTPTGIISITENGTYDVTNYASADVSVSGGGSLIYGSSVEDFWEGYTTNHTITIPNTTIAAYGLANKFFNVGGNSKIIFPNLTSIGGYGLWGFAQYGVIAEFSANAIITISNSHACDSMLNSNTGIKKLSFSGLTDITGSYGLSYIAQGTTSSATLEEIDFNSLERVNATYALYFAFRYQENLYKNKVGHPFPVLKYAGTTSAFNYTFADCEYIMLVFDSLNGIGNQAASSATMMTSMCNGSTFDYRTGDTEGRKSGLAFPKVKQIGYSATNTNTHSLLRNVCAGKTNNCAIYFDELTTIYHANTNTSYGHFNSCNINYVYMPKVTVMGTKSVNLFTSSTATTELHFGIANQATIEADAGYSSKFGATNATIYFDLANDITVDSVVYTRDGSKSDYDNWYFGWTNGSNTVYTDNFTGAVGDTTYTKSGTTYTASSTVTAVA